MSKNRFAGPVIAVTISVLFVAWMMSGSADDSANESQSLVVSKSLIPSVQVVLSESRSVRQSLEINGITQAKRSVTVRSEANGKVIRLLKEHGQLVKKNDVIAEIDRKSVV